MLARRFLVQNLLVLICGVFAAPSFALVSSLCDDAAQYASERTGVPLSILRAVTLVETGRANFETERFSAWPWAVQAHQKGNWFPDAQSAIAFIDERMGLGASNIDVGCFQLNIRWHFKGFNNLEEMISPRMNGLYAANFLKSLYLQTGDWREAVGRYHSSDTERAEAYVQRLEKLFLKYLSAAAPTLRLQPAEAPAQPANPPQRFGLVAAHGPLLQSARSTRPIIGGSP